MIKNIILVFIGGGFGSIMRYALTLMIAKTHYSTKFPLNTFLCNIIGSLLIGIAISYLTKNHFSDIYMLLVVGSLGGFTTFSAFSLETISLLKQGNIILAAIYVISSVSLCLLCTFLGYYSNR